MKNKELELAVIVVFAVGIAFIVAAIIVYDNSCLCADNGKSYASALIGIATLITANIGATQVKS